MLLFKKKDLLVVISKSGETVQFTKPLKDILKYQHRYNYKFKMYENGKVTVADDYVIEGETLTVLFGSATVSYTSEGATYTEGSGGGSSEGGIQLYGPYTAKNVTDTQFGEASTITFGVGSVFTNRLIIYDNDDTQRQWNDEAKFLFSGIETPGGTILKAVGCVYGDPPVVALKREDESITQISAESVFISFYTDVELEESLV